MSVADCATNLDAIVAALIGGATIGALAVAMLRVSRPDPIGVVWTHAPLDIPFEPWRDVELSRREWYALPAATRRTAIGMMPALPTGVLMCGVDDD